MSRKRTSQHQEGREVMPNSQALQFFYATMPLTLVVVAAHLRKSTLLKGILQRLTHLDVGMGAVKDELS
jgi:hypothetical protein